MATEETTETEAKDGDDAGKKPSAPPPSKKTREKKNRKKSAAELQKEIRELTTAAGERPPVDLKKMYLRVGAVALVVWIIAAIVPGWIPKAAAGALTLGGVAVLVWLNRYVKKTSALGAILKGADSQEGRKKALEQIAQQFKKGDTQAVIAKAQLQMQDEPRAALATLEAINLDKELAPVAGQIRAMRAMIHLTLGETTEARALADKLDLGKQQESKTRVMFAAVAAEAWARTGQGQKAVDTMDLFNPEEPDMADMRAQLWRSRAFAYAATNDVKGVARAVKKMAEMNPQLLGMFVGQKKVHPLLEREAKQLVMRMGIVPRKMIRKRM